MLQARIPSGQTEVSGHLSSLPAAMCATPGEGSKDASGSLGCLPSGDEFSIFPGRDTTVSYAGQLFSRSEWGSVLRTGWGHSSRKHVCEHWFPRPPPGNHSWPRPRNKHSVARQADVLAPVSRSCPAGVPYMWQTSGGVLPIWPWVLRHSLFSCQMGLPPPSTFSESSPRGSYGEDPCDHWLLSL